MRKLVMFTVLMITSQLFIVASQYLSEKGKPWIIVISSLIIIALIIHFFIEYKKLNKLK